MTALYDIAKALREAAVMHVSVVSAFKPGDVIVLECDRYFSDEAREKLRLAFADMLEQTDIKIILLEPGMRVAARESLSVKAIEEIGGPRDGG